MKRFSEHSFQYIPRRKPKVHFLSGWEEPKVKAFKYHCKNCDSTIEVAEKVTEKEVNMFFSDPSRHFPCMLAD